MSSNSTNSFSRFEDIISIVGSLSWILSLINIFLAIVSIVNAFAVINEIQNLIGSNSEMQRIYQASLNSTYSSLIWAIIQIIFIILVAITYILRTFSVKCKEKDWEFLLTDVFIFGTYQIPKMLFWGIILAIFGQVWGSAMVLVPALVLIFNGPRPFSFKKNTQE